MKCYEFFLSCWKQGSRLSSKNIQKEVKKCIQKSVNGFVFCDEEWKPFREEECDDLWSCPNANGKLKSSFPSPYAWEDDSDGKENVNTSSFSDFPNKLPRGNTYFN